MGLPGGPIENTVHTFNGNLKCFDDTFATIKYKVAHQSSGKAKFGVPADHVCRRAKGMVESEKILAENRFSPKRESKSMTGRTTVATGDDYNVLSTKISTKSKGKRIGNSR
jgi:hypothetical protein